MTEEAGVNIVAVMYPKAGKLEELSTHLSDLSKQVQANEPDTLLYYAFANRDGNEITVVERYRDQTALQTHLLSPYFRDFGSRASPLMEKPYEVKVGSGFLPGSVGVLRG
ncbi:hypothetical protein P168DRAFT_300602 [Aspergillus campestris IBT 28561]|uniref:ABM domain-containing protein n=1 Tax=Aspergillus campestris (strain IBT 28561) TaxID=1392248 RepID=A0A2I1DD25_ASPC2|nr:uncharacterized protein P168DRAFT_300602 [Aspergillus campestris IBT 28561]PKY07782.1 hypothetical protein P168DRAFT_300602 [Aspergillus campestris IBT 28561]